jgi:hypothetical protein
MASPLMSKTKETNEQKWAALEEELRDEPAKLSSFYENPLPVLEAAGIEAALVPPEEIDEVKGLKSIKKASAGESFRVKKYWWGQKFIMNEKLTSDIVEGVEVSGGIAALVGPALLAAGAVTAGTAALVGAGLALVFIAKRAEIKMVDNGKGVYWPITWLQWGALAASAPGGPVTFSIAAAAVLHPFRR